MTAKQRLESVVEKVLEKLETRQKLVPEHLVGLDDRVKHLTELLDVNYRDVRLIAIYGMGGIGKTTIAKVIFNHLSFHFGKCRSFLEDVRESSSTKEGIVELRRNYYRRCWFRIVEQFKDSEHGMQRIGDTLSTKKVLVVLDDVDNREHIKKLIGHSLLHLGSRIIITTRNIAILQVEGFKGKILPFEMLKMDDGLALQLFCRHAFGRDIPPDDYQEISSEIVSSTGGLPLAIEVTGSLLRRRDEAFWKETFVRLRNVPEEGILKKLRISYDDLDVYQQQIFLDIACFFFNKSKIDAIYMWTDCQFYPERGIEVLTNKCLIKIFDNDKFWMHDQLIDMGRQIVRQENPSNLGKRSRLWTANEVLEIIKIEERKDKVQALQKNGRDHSIEITNEDFERFPNLRLLELQHGTFARDFKRCHSNLRWFLWSFPPEKDFRADNLYLDRLVVCNFHCIDFEDDSKAWDLIKRARALKLLSITWCLGITTVPDISRCLNLERLTLEGCFGLKRIESFIGNLQSLIELKIEQCEHFMDLPEEIGNLVKLQHFSLSRCNKLRELPCSIGNLTSLAELNLSVCALPNF
ncbi:disease resistance protein RPV1-like [Eucalyptus grandis]|uniref:disease resistance protein RPV1-like n=1 Tax=Eucalyptus grandis TaxID=71139 RepID=UPI00192EE936|nr:disease resistance protein RPV1-like [Eucalyptus grandis]